MTFDPSVPPAREFTNTTTASCCAGIKKTCVENPPTPPSFFIVSGMPVLLSAGPIPQASPVRSIPKGQVVRSGISPLQAYAVSARSRLASAPDIPTVDQAGLPGFYVTAWFAFFAPKGAPKPIIDKLNAATVDGLAAPEVRARLADLGLELYPREEQTPEALAAVQKADIEKWWPIVKAAGIKGGL